MSTKLRPSLQTQPTKFYLGNALCGRAAQILKNAKKSSYKKKKKKKKQRKRHAGGAGVEVCLLVSPAEEPRGVICLWVNT
jgi:hypothetical protein